ncbi:MAG TPA: hypothetical protein VEJ38_13985 [Candidatus Acidoferrales bacterium]|nr:hypothetical protein [Candidatus Acidoferrales bacterium]
MPDDKKLDPFKPEQPSIPGLKPTASKAALAQPPSQQAAPRRESSSKALVWIVAAIVVVFIMGGAIYFWLHGTSPKASEPIAQSAADAATTSSDSAKPAEKLATGPGPVASVDALAKPWAGKRFLFRDPLTSEAVPAMVVHLPDGNYWAFSLREPFGTCELEYVTDLDKLRTDYSYLADHPMVGNPCNHSVYDLLRYGSSSNGGLVRGEVVQGAGIRPPMAIEVRIDGKEIVAVRME